MTLTKDTGSTPEAFGRADVVHTATWEIGHPIESVFPALFDFASWQGYDTVEHLSGPIGEEGDLMRIKKPESEPGWQEKHCKVIRLDPGRQIIWRVYTGPGQVGPGGWEHEWSATIDYRVEADGPDATVVRMQVIKEYLVPTRDEGELARVRTLEYDRQAEMAEHLRRSLLAFLDR